MAHQVFFGEQRAGQLLNEASRGEHGEYVLVRRCASASQLLRATMLDGRREIEDKFPSYSYLSQVLLNRKKKVIYFL